MSDSDINDTQKLGDFLESDDDLSDAESEHSDHDTQSEESNSEDETQEESADEIREEERQKDRRDLSMSSNNYFYGKNRYKWSKIPPTRTKRTAAHNIISERCGLKGRARAMKPSTPNEAWQLLITEEILEIIVEQTNAKITEFSFRYRSDHISFTNHLGIAELRAFLGLLILAGVFKSGRENLASLWASDGTGRDIFRATMPLQRFLLLLCAERFDDAGTRDERIAAGETAAPISEIFQKFIKNCKENYTCSEYVTVDEMLVPFRGRCKFRMYIKSKPAKYGLKIMCLCDAKTHYLINAFIYTGKNSRRQNSNPRKLSVPTLDVLSLIKPIENTNRNVTGNNWFTSNELVNKLKSKGLTYVGTVRKNKRDVPPEFQPHKLREVNSSLFGFTGDRTLVSSVPKKNKSVLLLSSMHHTNIVNQHSKKPEINEFYNSTKTGVDSLDQKCATYSCNRKSRRWPLTIFFCGFEYLPGQCICHFQSSQSRR